MSEALLTRLLRTLFVLALVGFAFAFAWRGEPVFAGGLVTAALALAGSIVRNGGTQDEARAREARARRQKKKKDDEEEE